MEAKNPDVATNEFYVEKASDSSNKSTQKDCRIVLDSVPEVGDGSPDLIT